MFPIRYRHMRHHCHLGMNHKQGSVFDKKSITILIDVELGTRTYLLVWCRVWNRSWTTNAMRRGLAIIENNNHFLNLDTLPTTWFAVHTCCELFWNYCLRDLGTYLKNDLLHQHARYRTQCNSLGRPKERNPTPFLAGRHVAFFFKSVAYFR